MHLFRKTFSQKSSFCHFILTSLSGKSMKRYTAILLALFFPVFFAHAQNVTTVEEAAKDSTLSSLLEIAAEMTKVVVDMPEKAVPVEKPVYWTKKLATQIGFSQVGVTEWADGGNQTLSLNSFIDGFANYKKDKLIWENRLQMAYGFTTDIDDRFTKKSDDRIQLDSKFGYGISPHLYLSAQYTFKTQFANGFKYEGNTIVSKESGLLSPAYTNLALGFDYKPAGWIAVNFAPLTGGVVIVAQEDLRKKYGNVKVDSEGNEILIPVKFELGAQLKADIKLQIGSNFYFSSYLTLFSNYLDKPQNLRVTWDTVTEYKLNKFFSLNFRTYLLYDDNVLLTDSKKPDAPPRQMVQFKEVFSIGFAYSFGG